MPGLQSRTMDALVENGASGTNLGQRVSQGAQDDIRVAS